MLRLIVKGTPEQATNAALARGIPFSVSGVTQIPTHPATVGYVEESYKPAVIAWFCEDEHMPFPAGTLLLY